MTVYEFCKEAGISHQAVYKKINSAPEKFKGHITYKGRKKETIADLDEYAMHLLKPRLTKFDSIEESNKKLTSENAELLETNKKLSSDLAELDEKFTALNEKYNKKVSECNDTVHRLNELSDEYKWLQHDMEKLQKKNETLEKTIEDNKALHRQQLDEMYKKCSDTEEELSNLRCDNGKLVDENNMLRKQIPKKTEKDGKFSLFKKNRNS